MTFLRTHLTTIVVAGLTALACSTGGAVAGSMITGAQIKNNTVTGADIKNQSLGKVDLSAAAVKALHGATGKPGANGKNGTNGTDGAPGISGYVLVQSQKNVAANTTDTLVNTCPDNKFIISANAYWQSSRAAVQVATTQTQGSAYTTGVSADDLLVLNLICGVVTQ